MSTQRIPADPVGTAFTYQGQLTSSGNAANGLYDFQFCLRDTLAAGNPVSATNHLTTAVANGLFTVILDFGASSLTNTDRWLEIAVRTNGSGAFATLSPRQKLTPVPYAILSASAVSATTLADTFSGNLAGGTNFNGINIQPGTVNTNAFDPSTRALLAAAGTGGVSSNSPTLVNPKFTALGSTNFMFIGNGTNGVAGGSLNTIGLFSSVGMGNMGALDWYSDANHWFDIRYWSTHGGPMQTDTPEVVFAIPGSVAWFTDWIQHGAPDPGGNSLHTPFEYWNSALAPYVKGGMTNFNLHDSQALWLFPASYSPDNGNTWLTAGSQSVLGFPAFMAPAMHFRATSTNGSAAWTFYDSFNATLVAQGQYSGRNLLEHRNYDTAVERMSIHVGPDADNVAAVTVNGVVAASGFSGGLVPLAAGWSSFTNGLAVVLNTNLNGRSIILLSYVSQDGTIASLAEDLPARTNGVSFTAKSSNASDRNSFAWTIFQGAQPIVYDRDAAAFFARATNLSVSEKNALDALVVDAKAGGWWTNETAIYPFVGGTANLHALNLKTNNFTITWHGALASPAAHDANGVTSSGTGDYGDLGFSPANGAPYTTNGAHLFCYFGSFNGGNANWGTNDSGPDFLIMGGFNRENSPYYKNCIRLQYLSGVWWNIGAGGLNTTEWQTSNSDIASFASSLNSTDFRGPYAVARSDATSQRAYLRNTVSGVYSTVATGLAANNFLVFAASANNSNAVGDNPPFGINLRGAMIGGPLDPTSWAKVSAAWDKFEAALGRKVP